MYWAFYTNWFIPRRFAGYVYGPFIFIRPTHRNDIGLLEHEKCHVRQFFRFQWCNKFKREVEAYTVQLKYSLGNEWLFAGFIATKYGLDITQYEAYKLLKG